jgi:hypothetical protein
MPPLNTGNVPFTRGYSATDPSIQAEIVEQATAAPGEKRDLPPEKRCGVGASRGHPCVKQFGHIGPHAYEWSDGE